MDGSAGHLLPAAVLDWLVGPRSLRPSPQVTQTCIPQAVTAGLDICFNSLSLDHYLLSLPNLG